MPRRRRRRRRAIPGASDGGLVRRIAEQFGARLQRIRRERGWKQDAFAEAFGVSRTTASNIECGRQRVFLDQAYRAASILGVPLEALLPSVGLVTHTVVVHAAADEPLPQSIARNLAKTLEAVVHEVQAPPPADLRRRAKE